MFLNRNEPKIGHSLEISTEIKRRVCSVFKRKRLDKFKITQRRLSRGKILVEWPTVINASKTTTRRSSCTKGATSYWEGVKPSIQQNATNSSFYRAHCWIQSYSYDMFGIDANQGLPHQSEKKWPKSAMTRIVECVISLFSKNNAFHIILHVIGQNGYEQADIFKRNKKPKFNKIFYAWTYFPHIFCCRSINGVYPPGRGMFHVAEASHANLRCVIDCLLGEKPSLREVGPTDQSQRDLRRPLAQPRPSVAPKQVSSPPQTKYFVAQHLRRHVSIHHISTSLRTSIGRARYRASIYWQYAGCW